MQNISQPEWWKLRRVQWPLGALLLLGVVLGLAVLRSNASRVVVFNQTEGVLSELTIRACGQERTFHQVGSRESVRLKLSGPGAASDIVLLTNGVPVWRGDYLEPEGGYRAMVRLHRDGRVDCITTISWWQEALGRSRTLNPELL